MSMSKPKKEGPTAEERALAERSANEWNYFVENFMPAQDRFVQLVRPSGDDRQRIGAEASATAAAETAGAGLDAAMVARDLEQGVAPSSRVLFQMGDESNRFAAGVGAGRAAGETELENRELRGLMKASANMRGLADQSQMGLEGAGRRNTEAALRENIRDQEWRQSLVSAGMTGLGMYGGYKGWFDKKKAKQPGTGGPTHVDRSKTGLIVEY